MIFYGPTNSYILAFQKENNISTLHTHSQPAIALAMAGTALFLSWEFSGNTGTWGSLFVGGYFGVVACNSPINLLAKKVLPMNFSEDTSLGKHTSHCSLELDYFGFYF